MKFGPVPLDHALGCILAHSVSTPSGRLRKGATLAAGDIARLRDAGLSDVIAATLEQGDIGEDNAAHQLGAALLGGAQHIHATTAATGRVNLIANQPGVALFDLARINAFNAVDPMITLATVPHHHQMDAGGMLGTVKIISYAVAGDALAAACSAAKGAVSLAPPLGLSVSLIITQINVGADERKATKVTRARIEALGGTLDEVVTTPHRIAPLAAALHAARGDLILILTGSATSDAHDVAPAAVTDAGGRVERFGMPVDPGNLLFLGALGERKIIGLPGCARSPALNGADKVLSRVMCGVPVSSADIAGMGVGGLLKEIPTRPRPRRA